MSADETFFRAVGLGVTREDISLIIYQGQYGLSEDSSDDKANRLTDAQMERIGEAFSETLFEEHDGLYAQLLRETFEYLERAEPTVIDA
jgi:hypothetical protein